MSRWIPFVLTATFICGCLWAQSPDNATHEALRQLAIRADEGDAKALYQLATLHDRGFDTVQKDSLRSTALYLLSAQKGYAPAKNFIGFRYYKGEIVNKNIDSALYWIRSAANDGDITAATNLAYLLSESEDVTHDSVEAASWFQIAAEAGVREAQLKLIDIKEKEWKSLNSDSLLAMGLNYYTGAASILGFKLIELASEGGWDENDSISRPKTWALLGDAYSKGLGVPYDHQKSVDYFFKAARAGNPAAQFIIAELLDFFPDSTPSDSTLPPLEESAAYWYEQAAKQGIHDSEEAYSSLVFKSPPTQ